MRACPECRSIKPAWQFVLAADPVARARGYKTAKWCGDCLVDRGHVRASVLAAAARAQADPTPDDPVTTFRPVVLTDDQRATVRQRIADHTRVNDHIDAANADETYSRALLTAVRLTAAQRREALLVAQLLTDHPNTQGRAILRRATIGHVLAHHSAPEEPS